MKLDASLIQLLIRSLGAVGRIERDGTQESVQVGDATVIIPPKWLVNWSLSGSQVLFAFSPFLKLTYGILSCQITGAVLDGDSIIVKTTLFGFNHNIKFKLPVN